jgi:NAD(P)-dependent dehydrogenase (short-subunit alcohol dehydrogenase family)
MSNSKTILVTGASDGIGKQTALELAHMGHHVLLHGRDEGKTHGAPGAQLSYYLADFSSFEQVSCLAELVKKDHPLLDVLVNNAATFSKERLLSTDGFELTFAVNHLAPLLLTLLLLGSLKSAAPARIVNVASNAHRNLSEVDLDNLQGGKSYNGYDAYALSKLAKICVSYALVRRLEGSDVTVNSLHPGVINTKLLRMSWDTTGNSVEEGAKTSVHLASSPEMEGVSGRFYSRMAEKSPSTLAQDESLQEQFWRISMEMLAPYLPEDLKGL